MSFSDKFKNISNSRSYALFVLVFLYQTLFKWNEIYFINLFFNTSQTNPLQQISSPKNGFLNTFLPISVSEGVTYWLMICLHNRTLWLYIMSMLVHQGSKSSVCVSSIWVWTTFSCLCAAVQLVTLVHVVGKSYLCDWVWDKGLTCHWWFVCTVL